MSIERGLSQNEDRNIIFYVAFIQDVLNMELLLYKNMVFLSDGIKQ